MNTIVFRHLAIRDLRNLHDVDLEPSPTVNVVFGDNGQGKTSLLEAIYLVATTRSFRTHRIREAIAHGAEAGSVRALVDDSSSRREQMVAISATQHLVRIDGQKPESLASYAVRTPVVVFHPGELGLTMGTASIRRTMIDRVALFLNPASLEELRAYTRAMKTRQRLLQTEGVHARSLEVWEQLLAAHGARLTRLRRAACERLDLAASEAFRAMAPDALRMTASYAPGGSEDPAVHSERLMHDREQDLRRASARFGPHRDDLSIKLNGRSARVVASQGQHRLMTLSLKVAELECVAQGSGSGPVLLLDDVSSELDGGRTEAFFSLLGSRRDQVFLTTARPEILAGLERALGEATLFEVAAGMVSSRVR